MENIQMGRIYAPENESGERDVLYPETNAESVISRYNGTTPITLTNDIGPKIIFGTVSSIDEPSRTNREVLNIKYHNANVSNIPTNLLG